MSRLDEREAPMSAQELVERYKRSGQFDALRKQLLHEFMRSPSGDDFLRRIDGIIKLKLADSSTPLQSIPNTGSDGMPPAGPSHTAAQLQKSPTNKSKAEFADQVKQELTRQTAYSRAQEDLRKNFLTKTRKNKVEDQLTQLLQDARTDSQGKQSEKR